MRVLLVYCHPVPESFCASVRDEAQKTLAAGGHDVRLVDLYAENFDPVLSTEERRRYNDIPSGEPPASDHAEMLRWAEALVLVYPTWWYGLPAILKGWFDRAWAPGVAFELDPGGGAIRPLLMNIRYLVVLTTCGAPWWWSFLVGQPGRKTILRGIRALCARRCRTLFLAHYRMDASTPGSRTAFLARVRRKLAAI